MSITLDGTDLKDIGIRVLLDSEYPATPETRDRTVEIPGRHGEYDFGAEFGAMPHTIACRTFQQDNGSIQVVSYQLKRLLLDDYGRPKTVKLIYDSEPDKYYMVRLRGGLSLDRLIRMGEFDLPLTAHDPHSQIIVYSDEMNVDSTDLTVESLFSIDHEGTDDATTITSPTTLECYVDGLAVKPIIEISGSADNLTLSVDGQTLTLDNFSNSEWVINGSNYTVTKDGSNAFAQKQGDFLCLKPGVNNLTVTGDNLDLSIYVKYRDQFL